MKDNQIEIAEDFFQEKILIGDSEKVAEKIVKIKEDGHERLAVLTDFDKTLTKAYFKGKPFESIISVLREQNFLTNDYSDKAKALFAKYHPFENNWQLSYRERSLKMKDWWREHFELLIQSGLNKKDIETAVDFQGICLREGVEEWLKSLAEKQIPLLIVSAGGLGVESIGLFLKKQKLFFANIQIISNEFVWNENGKAIGFKEPIVHSCNKNGALLRDLPVLKGRDNFIVLGDGIDDLDVINGLKVNNSLTFLFFNKPKNDLLEYQKSADVVICGDGTFNYLKNLEIF